MQPDETKSVKHHLVIVLLCIHLQDGAAAEETTAGEAVEQTVKEEEVRLL